MVICAKPGHGAPVEDCFLAGAEPDVAAHGLGLGSCPIGFARSWFNRAEVKAELGIPAHYEAVLPIAARPPGPPAAGRAAPRAGDGLLALGRLSDRESNPCAALHNVRAEACRRYCYILTMASSVESRPHLFSPPASAGRERAAPVPVSVFLPKEHGSWSLALEPLALGLLLAPSVAGGALLAASLAGFFARRPLKTALAAPASSRRREARVALAILAGLAAVGGLEVLVLGGFAALWPVLLAVPLGLLFAHFDAQGEGRAAAAEIAGCATFAVLPAVFGTLAGWSAPAALALAVLALVRSVPTVLTIRAFLRQRKGESAGSAVPLLPGGHRPAARVGASSRPDCCRGSRPAGPCCCWAARSGCSGPWRPAWSAKRAGMTEGGLGVSYLILAALSACTHVRLTYHLIGQCTACAFRVSSATNHFLPAKSIIYRQPPTTMNQYRKLPAYAFAAGLALAASLGLANEGPTDVQGPVVLPPEVVNLPVEQAILTSPAARAAADQPHVSRSRRRQP